MMRFIPTYRQTLYLIVATALLCFTGAYLHDISKSAFFAALGFGGGVLGFRELLADVLTADTGGAE